MCKVAGVQVSGYYYLKHKDDKSCKDYRDYVLVKAVFDKKKGKIGAKTIKMKLEDINIVMNLKKIYRLMNKYGLVCKIRKINKSRVSLQKNKENIAVKNLLNREFRQKTPYKYLSTDITYLKHSGRFSFLSTVKDLASGEILSWELTKTMDLVLVLRTITKLERYFKARKLSSQGVLLHSDQGFQYTNIIYHNKLKSLGVIQSMSRKGNSVDNAPIESFFGHMKDEIEIKDLNFNQISEVINGYMLEYNYERRQWSRKR